MDALLRNYKPAMKQLAKVLASMQGGQVSPEMLPNAAAAAVQAALTPEELSMLANEMQGQSQGGKAPPAKVQQNRGDSAAVRTGAGVQLIRHDFRCVEVRQDYGGDFCLGTRLQTRTPMP